MRSHPSTMPLPQAAPSTPQLPRRIPPHEHLPVPRRLRDPRGSRPLPRLLGARRTSPRSLDRRHRQHRGPPHPRIGVPVRGLHHTRARPGHGGHDRRWLSTRSDAHGARQRRQLLVRTVRGREGIRRGRGVRGRGRPRRRGAAGVGLRNARSYRRRGTGACIRFGQLPLQRSRSGFHARRRGEVAGPRARCPCSRRWRAMGAEHVAPHSRCNRVAPPRLGGRRDRSILWRLRRSHESKGRHRRLADLHYRRRPPDFLSGAVRELRDRGVE